jgi:hypothetical protein
MNGKIKELFISMSFLPVSSFLKGSNRYTNVALEYALPNRGKILLGIP